MSHTATIEVRYADQPKAGKKQGTVKTKDGDVYGVWPDKLGLLRPGRRYRVEYKERQFEGRTFRTITKVDPAAEGETDTGSVDPLSSSDETGPNQEAEMVCRLVAAAIQSQQVEFNPTEIGRAMRMVQAVVREHQRQTGAMNGNGSGSNH